MGRIVLLSAAFFLLLSFQNCGSGFTALNKNELLSMGCGKTVQCDSLGYPLGRIVVDQLPAADYPFGSYSAGRVETKTNFVTADSIASILRIRNLPTGWACPQTWLKDSYATQSGINTVDLLGTLDRTPCRLGDVDQENEFLNSILKSGCFFVETNYIVKNDLSSGQLIVNSIGTAVIDDELSRPRVPTARIQFRCAIVE